MNTRVSKRGKPRHTLGAAVRVWTASKRPPTAALMALTIAWSNPSGADVILDWNRVVNDTMKFEAGSPTAASRSMAMVHTAMFDAVNAVEQRYHSFAYEAAAASKTASLEAAAAQAARDVLSSLYPNRTSVFDNALAQTLSAVSNVNDRDAGRAIGAQSAAAMLALRNNDGSGDMTRHDPVLERGRWRPTPPDFAGAMTPKWGAVTPFTLEANDQFQPVAPPSLTSAEYTAAFNEVKSLGEKHSTTRTDEQTEIGLFWAYDVATLGPPPVLYNQIAAVIARDHGNTLMQNARMFALLNLAQADAGIAAWGAKYVYDVWRPISGVQLADTDGNPDTEADLDWEPLGAPGNGVRPDFTPPFPAYVSGHAAFGAAVLSTIGAFYGTDDITFTIGSDEFDGILRPEVFRSYNSLGEAIVENAISRIYLGIHWRFDAEQGVELGMNIADWVMGSALTPVSEPNGLLLVGVALALPLGLTRRPRTRY